MNFESLANELLFELFEFLDGIYLLHAFMVSTVALTYCSLSIFDIIDWIFDPYLSVTSIKYFVNTYHWSLIELFHFAFLMTTKLQIS